MEQSECLCIWISKQFGVLFLYYTSEFRIETTKNGPDRKSPPSFVWDSEFKNQNETSDIRQDELVINTMAPLPRQLHSYGQWSRRRNSRDSQQITQQSKYLSLRKKRIKKDSQMDWESKQKSVEDEED